MRLSLTALLALALASGCSADRPPAAGGPGPGTSSAGTSSADAPIAGVVLTPGIEPSHREGRIRYDRVPPVGGPHNPAWVRCEVYDSPVPPEMAVHALEHGAVWLAHEPDLADEEVRRLAALHDLDATTREYVLVSPYEQAPSPVVAVAWGASLAVESADDPRLTQFVRRYAGGAQGGEPGAPCTSASSALDAAQARALIAEQG